jgi:hypothetical protein
MYLTYDKCSDCKRLFNQFIAGGDYDPNSPIINLFLTIIQLDEDEWL